jgi:aminoglycoside phosphotransferase (APT) family kinase protein
MRTQPADLPDARIAAALAAGWGVDAASVAYLPVGFGSHHWHVAAADGEWFVTADDLDARRSAAGESRDAVFNRLRAALRTARALRDSGLWFVVAPRADRHEEVLGRIPDRYALAVYPHVEGRAGVFGPWESPADRAAIVDLLAAVHGAPPRVRVEAGTDDFGVARRDDLEDAIRDVGRAWDAGPFSERTRDLLARHADGVGRLLERHDRLAALARRAPDRFVLTHGEPHPGNAIRTDRGLVLVDWDTVLLAPPERDLWMVADGDPSSAAVYAAATGRALQADMLELYRLRWDLADIADFVALLRGPHEPTADTAKSWASLEVRLDLDRRWPAIAGRG